MFRKQNRTYESLSRTEKTQLCSVTHTSKFHSWSTFITCCQGCCFNHRSFFFVFSFHSFVIFFLVMFHVVCQGNMSFLISLEMPLASKGIDHSWRETQEWQTRKNDEPMLILRYSLRLQVSETSHHQSLLFLCSLWCHQQHKVHNKVWK